MLLYEDVPRDYLENLKYRRELRDHARRDPKLRAAIRTACRDDILFFFQTMCWLEEPRPEFDDGMEKSVVIPFIIWPHQIPVIQQTYEKLGFEDVGWSKTRGEGASWIACLFAVHDWLFIRRCRIGLVSRNEDYADTPDNMDSLFAKIDWSLKMLPRWMGGVENYDWRRNTTKHTLRNLRNDSTIAAYAATGDVASGGRCRWFLLDELAKFPKPFDKQAMASTQPVTNSRLFVSTFKGTVGAYYDIMTQESSMLRLVLDWRDNPTKNRGLYRMVRGKPEAVDPVSNPLLPHYDPPTKEVLANFAKLRRRGFNLEKNTRSEWYDNECLRGGATPENIAEELDRDPMGSMGRYFSDAFNRIVAEAVHSTSIKELRGNFIYRPESLEDGDLKYTFDLDPEGEFYLWCGLDDRNRPPKGSYSLGADICQGGGGDYTSNSVITVIDNATGEQVLEYSSNIIEPAQLADLAVALGYWFYTAFLSYESNGPGKAFGNRVAERRYPDVFKRVPAWKIARNINSDPEPGFFTDKNTKPILFSDITISVLEGVLVPRSKALKEEFHQYIKDKGKIVHAHNPSGADQSHGDRVIALGVCWQAAKLRPQARPGEEKPDPSSPPPNTMAYRLSMHHQEERWLRDECREREPGELLGNVAFSPGPSALDLY